MKPAAVPRSKSSAPVGTTTVQASRTCAGIARSRHPLRFRSIVKARGTPLSSLERRRRIRALTSLELEDEEALRWFVIQLSLSEEAFRPDSLPNLDIFSMYRLYSVAGIDQGRVMHPLRLGFFSEEIAAGAVASYLAAFIEKPIVKRISAAERDRFADQCVEARKDIGATGKHGLSRSQMNAWSGKSERQRLP